ncbi:hypothetical protein [Secundilactobacillus oryzae]|uniref:hypothetical protein n=1 Tax=Secundilactobacillus oryzae TaxID=1202668 RepID=UPI000AC485F7
MKNTHKLLLGAALLTLSGTLAACGSGEANSDSNHNKVTLMQNTELLSLDNSSVADFTQWNTLENSMEGLYRQDKNNKLAPAMATKVVQPTNNGKTYTFHLRKKC